MKKSISATPEIIFLTDVKNLSTMPKCSPKHACVYPNKDFTGNHLSLNHPLSLEDFDKSDIKVGSIVIPPGHEARLYGKPRYGKLKRVIRGPKEIPDISTAGIKSLLLVHHASTEDEPTDFATILYYPDHNGKLEGISFDSPLEVDNVTTVGIPNDSISQVKVGKNVILTLYEDLEHSGNKIVLPGPFTGSVGALAGKVSSFTVSTKENANRVSLLENNSGMFSNWAFWLLLILAIILLIYLFWNKSRSANTTAVPYASAYAVEPYDIM